MTTFLLTIEYDGTHYHGWQVQAMGHRSIQETIEAAITQITGQTLRLHASGRTDAGVHAIAQTAHFTCDTRISPETFVPALNSVLPPDIRILSCVSAPDGFHARFSPSRKTYRYYYTLRSVAPAIGRHYGWHIKTPLRVSDMQKAARYLVGEHDFAAFEGAGSPRPHTIRTIFHADVTQPNKDQLMLEITGNGFLRFMVRNIAGTLAEIGRGKKSPSDMKQILESKSRAQAGITAPPQGLFLYAVQYDTDPRDTTT